MSSAEALLVKGTPSLWGYLQDLALPFLHHSLGLSSALRVLMVGW